VVPKDKDKNTPTTENQRKTQNNPQNGIDDKSNPQLNEVSNTVNNE